MVSGERSVTPQSPLYSLMRMKSPALASTEYSSPNPNGARGGKEWGLIC